MVRFATASYVNPNPVIVRCARCGFVAEATVQEAHAAFESHSCAAAAVDDGRTKS